MFSSRIVGYSIDSRMKASLAVAALRNAIGLRHGRGTVVHSDRGSQFRSAKFVRALRDAGLQGSMGRVGACADNAAMESFFALLQKNVLDRTLENERGARVASQGRFVGGDPGPPPFRPGAAR